jgi:hypothetical protein
MACQDTTPTPKEKTARGPADTLRLSLSSPISPFPILQRWYRTSVLRVLLWEGNAALQRIRWVLEIRAVERLSGKVSVRQWRDQSLVPAAYKSAYIDHMQRTEARHPFLSIFDLLLLSQAWKAGLEYGIRIGRSQNQDMSCDQISQVPGTGIDVSGQ